MRLSLKLQRRRRNQPFKETAKCFQSRTTLFFNNHGATCDRLLMFLVPDVISILITFLCCTLIFGMLSLNCILRVTATDNKIPLRQVLSSRSMASAQSRVLSYQTFHINSEPFTIEDDITPQNSCTLTISFQDHR